MNYLKLATIYSRDLSQSQITLQYYLNDPQIPAIHRYFLAISLQFLSFIL